MSLNNKYNDYSSAFGSLYNVIDRIVVNKELTQDDKDLVASLTPVKDETLAGVKSEIDKVKQSYSDSKIDYLTNKVENIKSIIEKNDDSIQIGVSGIVDNKEKISQINIDIEGIGSRVGDLEGATNVTSVKSQYYLSTSREELLGGSWLDKLPTKEEQQNKSLWFKYVTTYTDKTTKETEPVCISAQDGKDGLNGADGVDGKNGTSIIWQGSKSSHPASPQNGWAYYNTTDKKSYVYQSGSWYQMTIDGQDGIKGNDGKDGLSIEYKGELSSPPSNPVKNWTYKDSDNGVVYIYTGTAWEVMTYDGNNGNDGANGQNGLSVFITYNDSATQPATPTGDGTTGGWHTNSTSNAVWMSQKVASSTSAGTWGTPIKIKGDQGIQGPTGSAATYVLVTGEQIFKYTNNFTGNPTPTSITLTATKMNTTATGKWQYKNGSGVWTDLGVTTVTTSITPTTGLFATSTVRAMTVRYIIGTDISDERTLVKVSDGAQGTQGNTGATGATGADAYTIILSNESNTFAGSTTGAIAGSTTCVITALKGTTLVAATIGTISGLPTGMTAPITNNGTTTATFTPTVTTAMITKAGVLTIPITVDGKLFTKYFSYSLALTGAKGDTGVSVEEVITQYSKGTLTTTAPTTGWDSSMPPYQEGYYLWIRTRIKYSNSSNYVYSTPVCDQSWKSNAEVYTQYKQLKDKFSWIVQDGTNASNMVLTKEMYSLVTTNVLIEAKKIELNGSIDINNGVFKVATNGNTKIGGLCDHRNSDGTTRGIFEVTSLGTLYSRSKTDPNIYTMLTEGKITVKNGEGTLTFDNNGQIKVSDGSTATIYGDGYIYHNNSIMIESGGIASTGFLASDSYLQGTGVKSIGELVLACDNANISYTGDIPSRIRFRSSGGSYYFDPHQSGTVRNGSATYLWNVVYATNGVKTSSDRNSKENIKYLDYEELNPAAPIENDITTKDLLNFITNDYLLAIYNYVGQNDTKLSGVAQDVICEADGTTSKVGELIVDCEEATENQTMLTMNQTQLLNVFIGAFQEHVKNTNNRLNKLGV